MRYTIEMIKNTEYEKKNGTFAPVQKEIKKHDLIKLIGIDLFIAQNQDAMENDFSYMTTKDYIIRFYAN